MKYIDEFRQIDYAKKISRQIAVISKKEITLMEVCGGHTMAIYKFGIPSLLPPYVHLISGPGCPVCVTPVQYIDKAIAFSRRDDVIITTFGDLVRVPGSGSSLEKERAAGADVRIVYSSLEALEIADDNKDKKIIFLSVGFETTTPTAAASIISAQKNHLDNFFVYGSHKLMKPAMMALIDEGVKIDGYICPGHVSVVTGVYPYLEISGKYKLGCVISGFEPVDILKSIYMLVKQFEENDPKVEIAYKRAVTEKGNVKARKAMFDVFEPKDDEWRGIGMIPKSGLKIRPKYIKHDAEKQIKVKVKKSVQIKGCICGEILKGLKSPIDCGLFAKACSPANPIGACMVSSEGCCAAHYRYNR